MTTFVYNNARSLFATGALNWPACAAHAVLVTSAYTPLVTDQYFSAVPSSAVIEDVAMTGLGQSKGYCYGAIPQFNALISSSIVVGLLIYVSTGNPATSPLVYYSSDGVGFPFQPQGFNYAVGYDSSSGGYFQA
jgi:hypothetical protein